MGKPYFLGRPRRFGKSLFLSALNAYFLGKKELFEGLAIAGQGMDWTEYPVLYLDFNLEDYFTLSSFRYALDANLVGLEVRWGSDEREKTPALRLNGLIRRACKQTGRKVVVLVDEYDKPLIETMDNAKRNETVHPGFQPLLRSCICSFCALHNDTFSAIFLSRDN
jgi:hypothetical protein